jgi:hypothetical protein
MQYRNVNAQILQHEAMIRKRPEGQAFQKIFGEPYTMKRGLELIKKNFIK